jgi:hypothetical protein
VYGGVGMKQFYKDKEDWLNNCKVYLQSDVYADDFTTELKAISMRDYIELGNEVSEPEKYLDIELPFI